MNENKLITATISYEMDGQPGQIDIAGTNFESLVANIFEFETQNKGTEVRTFKLDDNRQFEWNGYVAHSFFAKGHIDEEKFIEMSLIR